MTLASAPKVRVDALVDAPPEDLNEIFATFGVGTRAAVSRGSRGGRPIALASRLDRTPARFVLDLRRI
jgi:hypothetical protein